MALPHELFAQLRIEIFDAEGLADFGRRLGYDKTHIYRLETGEARLLPKHVGLCHERLRVSSGRRAAFEAILKQLGDAVAAQEIPRIQAKKDKARAARRAREQARKAALAPGEPPREPDPAWLQSWEAAVAYLAEVEAQADWCAAVEFLQAQTDWTAALEFIIAAELARRHLDEEAWLGDWSAAVEFLQANETWLAAVEVIIAAGLVQHHQAEAWRADWSAAVEFLQAQADWTVAEKVLLAAAMIEALSAPAVDGASLPAPSRRASTITTTRPQGYRASKRRPHRPTSPFQRRALRQLQRRRARPRHDGPSRSRSYPHRRRVRTQRSRVPFRWMALSLVALTFYAMLALPVWMLAAERREVIDLVSQTPAERARVAAAMGERKPPRVRRLIPPKPMKGHKATPCDESSGEVAINGGCWYGGRDPGPQGCGVNEYEDPRSGRCYRYVQDPNTPPTSDLPADDGTGYGGAAGEKLEPRSP